MTRYIAVPFFSCKRSEAYNGTIFYLTIHGAKKCNYVLFFFLRACAIRPYITAALWNEAQLLRKRRMQKSVSLRKRVLTFTKLKGPYQARASFKERGLSRGQKEARAPGPERYQPFTCSAQLDCRESRALFAEAVIGAVCRRGEETDGACGLFSAPPPLWRCVTVDNEARRGHRAGPDKHARGSGRWRPRAQGQ